MRAIRLSAREFAEAHPGETARLLEGEQPSDAAKFLEDLKIRTAAGVLERMGPAAGAACLAAMASEEGAAVVAALAPGIAIALLRRQEPSRQETFLAALPENSAAGFRSLLGHSDGTVGSLTDPGALALSQDLTVAEALRQIRRHRAAAHHHVFVVDRAHQLVGVVHLRDLVGGRSKDSLATVMRPGPARLAAGGRLAAAAVHPAWKDLDALPVIDESGLLVGMVRHRQLRHIDDEPTGDWFTQSLLGLGELYWTELAKFLPTSELAEGGRNG